MKTKEKIAQGLENFKKAIVPWIGEKELPDHDFEFEQHTDAGVMRYAIGEQNGEEPRKIEFGVTYLQGRTKIKLNYDDTKKKYVYMVGKNKTDATINDIDKATATATEIRKQVRVLDESMFK